MANGPMIISSSGLMYQKANDSALHTYDINQSMTSQNLSMDPSTKEDGVNDYVPSSEERKYMMEFPSHADDVPETPGTTGTVGKPDAEPRKPILRIIDEMDFSFTPAVARVILDSPYIMFI